MGYKLYDYQPKRRQDQPVSDASVRKTAGEVPEGGNYFARLSVFRNPSRLSYVNSTREHLDGADRNVDKFHIAKHPSDAVDRVRRRTDGCFRDE